MKRILNKSIAWMLVFVFISGYLYLASDSCKAVLLTYADTFDMQENNETAENEIGIQNEYQLFFSSANQNKETIYRFLRNDLGLNVAAACGILANIYYESTFSPTAHNKNDTAGTESYGICQWNSGEAAGKRYQALINWCNSKGYNYTTLNAQLLFMKNELETQSWLKYSYLKNSIPNTSQGAYEAASVWAKFYEGCAASEYEKRMVLARDIYWKEYSGETPSASTSTPINPQGCLDAVEGGDGCIQVRGWAFDKNSCETALSIHVYVGGTFRDASWGTSTVVANVYRPDVNEHFPGVGDYHGFQATIKVPDDIYGQQPVYVYAINIGGSVGSDYNTCLGNKTVTITQVTASPTPTNTPAALPSTYPKETSVPTTSNPPTSVPTELPKQKYLYGDVNLDGEVAADDALEVLRHVVGLTILTGDKEQALADITYDEKIEAVDALEIIKVVVQLRNKEYMFL